MTKLPRDVPGSRAIRAFKKAGYVVDHQVGSHVVLYSGDKPKMKRLVIPIHSRIKPGLLSDLIKDAGLTVEQFKKLL